MIQATRDDPIGLEHYRDPYPRYADLRRTTPVLWFEPIATWFVFRHADVNAIMRSRQFGMSAFTPRKGEHLPAFSALQEGELLNINPPEHTRLRAIVAPWFVRGRLDTFRPLVRRIAGDLLKPRELDFVPDLAVQLPPAVLAAALGIPPADVYLLQPWSVAMVNYWEFHHEPEDIPNTERAAQEIGSYVGNVVRIRRTQPGDDVISHLIGAGLSDQEIVVMAVLLLNAGHETTVNLLGNALLALLEHRAAWQSLVADPSIAPLATEELLRYDTSIQTFPRTALQQAEIGGKTLAAGAKVRVVLGSANRDPDVFPDPDGLDLTRQPNPHLSFGLGIHSCLGAPLARLEIAETLAVLAEQRPDLELAGDPVRRPGYQVRGLRSLPLR